MKLYSAPSVGNVAEVEHDLLRLGNRPAVTPMQLCEADEVFVCTRQFRPNSRSHPQKGGLVRKLLSIDM